jgi:hypothetical protein
MQTIKLPQLICGSFFLCQTLHAADWSVRFSKSV